jgi:hypothetical protein
MAVPSIANRTNSLYFATAHALASMQGVGRTIRLIFPSTTHSKDKDKDKDTNRAPQLILTKNKRYASESTRGVLLQF